MTAHFGLGGWIANQESACGEDFSPSPCALSFPKAEGKLAVANSGFTGFFKLENNTLWAWREWATGLWLPKADKGTKEPPQWVLIAKDVRDVAVSARFGLFLKNDGTVWAWGDNSQGQFGNTTMEFSGLPVQVLFPKQETGQAD